MDVEVLAMKFTPASFKRPKYFVIVIAGLLITTLAVYAAFSYFYWHDYDSRSPQAAATLKTKIETTFTPDSKTAPASAIDDVVNDFEHAYGSSPCQFNGWYQWQTVLPQLKAIGARCDERFFTALETTTVLKRLSAYLKDQQTVADLLITMTKATASPKDYAAAAKTWSDAESADLPDGGDVQPLTAKLKTTASAISKAFTALASADKKEDKSAFDTALADLKKAYADLKDIKTLASKTQSPLTDAVITAYEKL
jgi:predicted negative regulator of RcsB-dependent stress response